MISNFLCELVDDFGAHHVPQTAASARYRTAQIANCPDDAKGVIGASQRIWISPRWQKDLERRIVDRVVVLTWTPRGEVRRIVSMRYANEREKSATRNTLIDPDDAPELTDEWFQRADLHEGEKPLRRGRPPAEVTKTPIQLRLDPDIVDTFKASGRGWQTRMNDALRAWLKSNSAA